MTEYKRIYLDTCLFVYYLSFHDKYFPYVEKIIAGQIYANFYTSTISVMEYLVYPLRHNDFQKIMEFNSFVEALPIRVIPVGHEISCKAAEIRAQFQYIKPIDALHLATACQSNCEVFITNDKQLRQFTEIECMIIDDML